MLTPWQQRFPLSFAKYPDILEQDKAFQNQLVSIFAVLDDKGLLLDESVMTQLLSKLPDDWYEIKQLLDILSASHGLNHITWSALLNAAVLCTLQQAVSAVSPSFPMSQALWVQLSSSDDPDSLVKYLNSMHGAGMSSSAVMERLSAMPSSAVGALWRALSLFDLSGLPYDDTHVVPFTRLLNTFENPLCQEIFDARKRSFCDYVATDSEPVTQSVAVDIIRRLSAIDNETNRIRVFFNFFVRFKSAPYSQKYMLNMESELFEAVLTQLNACCHAAIAAIDTTDDYHHVQKAIAALRQRGDNGYFARNHRYHIARAIEHTDLYSQREFDAVIWNVSQILKKPYPELESFDEALQASRGYKRLASSALIRQSISTSASAATDFTRSKRQKCGEKDEAAIASGYR